MRVTICDVGPRDGLRNEPETLEPSIRAELVNRLVAAEDVVAGSRVTFIARESAPRRRPDDDLLRR